MESTLSNNLDKDPRSLEILECLKYNRHVIQKPWDSSEVVQLDLTDIHDCIVRLNCTTDERQVFVRSLNTASSDVVLELVSLKEGLKLPRERIRRETNSKLREMKKEADHLRRMHAEGDKIGYKTFKQMLQESHKRMWKLEGTHCHQRKLIEGDGHRFWQQEDEDSTFGALNAMCDCNCDGGPQITHVQLLKVTNGKFTAHRDGDSSEGDSPIEETNSESSGYVGDYPGTNEQHVQLSTSSAATQKIGDEHQEVAKFIGNFCEDEPRGPSEHREEEVSGNLRQKKRSWYFGEIVEHLFFFFLLVFFSSIAVQGFTM